MNMKSIGIAAPQRFGNQYGVTDEVAVSGVVLAIVAFGPKQSHDHMQMVSCIHSMMIFC